MHLHLSNLPALVVPSQNCNAMSVSHLQGHQQGNSLQTVIPAIDIISHEQIVSLGDRTTDPEKLGQIIELTMDITAYGHRGSYRLHIGFMGEYFFCLLMFHASTAMFVRT